MTKVFENIKSLGFAIGLALIFRSLLFEPFHIPSGSMRPALLEGDYIFVTKYSYGYGRYSFPFGSHFDYFEGRLPHNTYPKRGDVVVFRLPNDTTVDYIKRVMALPGETIRMSSGRVYLNEERLDYEKTEDFTYRESPTNSLTVARYIETLPNGVTHEVLDRYRSGDADNTKMFTVPEGHVFVMGDNRDESIDSRFPLDVGFVPLENIIGRADRILLSVDMGGESLLRTDRFLKAIK